MKEKCFKCGTTENVIVHHIKYEPEETIFCCRSCHKNIHNKVRRMGVCPLSIDETARESRKLGLKRYERLFMERIFFHSSLGNGWKLQEIIRYNNKTGNVYFWSGFMTKSNVVREKTII